MKHKLSSSILAIVLMFALSVPTFAADCRPRNGGDCQTDLIRQLLAQYGSCGQRGAQLDWEALLRLWLGAVELPEQTGTPEKPQEEPAQPETPAETQKPSVSAYEQEVARLVNEERAKAGLAPLTLDAELSRVARMKSQDMHDRGYFDHNSPTYGTPFQLMKSQGIAYRTAGENIAMGYRTPEAVVRAWMDSPGHRANILNASYTKLGVGYVADGNYWTQHFTG